MSSHHAEGAHQSNGHLLDATMLGTPDPNQLHARISALQSVELAPTAPSLEAEVAELRHELANLSECFSDMLDIVTEHANSRIRLEDIELVTDRVGLVERRLQRVELGRALPPTTAPSLAQPN